MSNYSYRRGSNCSVHGCPNYKLQRESNKSFFRMPKDPNLLKIWVAACKREHLDLFLKTENPEFFYNKYVICSDHFELTCFRNKNLFSQGLIPGSVPTLKVFNVETPIEEKISDKIPEVEIEKIWLDEDPNDEIETADVVILDEPTSLSCTSTNISLSLEEENIKLKHTINEYKSKLRYQTALLRKCKKRNLVLREQLLQKKILSNPVKNGADQTINLLRINLDDWE